MGAIFCLNLYGTDSCVLCIIEDNEHPPRFIWPELVDLPIIYPVEMPPPVEPGIFKKGARVKNKALRRELNFLPLKSLKSEPHIAKPRFSRRLEGGRAQAHKQKWKIKRQKKGLS